MTSVEIRIVESYLMGAASKLKRLAEEMDKEAQKPTVVKKVLSSAKNLAGLAYAELKDGRAAIKTGKAATVATTTDDDGESDSTEVVTTASSKPRRR